MKQKLIDKSTLVAEIERRKKEWSYGSSTEAKYKVEAYKELIEWIDTLEAKEVDLWQERFEIERDNAVRQYCEEHKIKLIEIPYTEYDNIEEILTKELNIKKHD